LDKGYTGQSELYNVENIYGYHEEEDFIKTKKLDKNKILNF